MRVDDVERVAALCGQLGYPSTASDVSARFQTLAALADHAVFVAEDAVAAGNTDALPLLAGWVHVHRALTLETDPCAEIGGLVVLESMRARGVGRLLMAAAERWAADHGYTEMRVRSNVVRGEAHEFYRRLGYEAFKTQLNFRKVL